MTRPLPRAAGRKLFGCTKHLAIGRTVEIRLSTLSGNAVSATAVWAASCRVTSAPARPPPCLLQLLCFGHRCTHRAAQPDASMTCHQASAAPRAVLLRRTYSFDNAIKPVVLVFGSKLFQEFGRHLHFVGILREARLQGVQQLQGAPLLRCFRLHDSSPASWNIATLLQRIGHEKWQHIAREWRPVAAHDRMPAGRHVVSMEGQLDARTRGGRTCGKVSMVSAESSSPTKFTASSLQKASSSSRATRSSPGPGVRNMADARL